MRRIFTTLRSFAIDLRSTTSSYLEDRLYLVRSVSRNFGRNKRGQTSRPVVGAEIQTSCNFKANLRDRYYLLGCVHCLLSSVVLESRDNLVVWYHSNISVSGNRGLFLLKDFI